MSGKLDGAIGFLSLQPARSKFLTDTRAYTTNHLFLVVPPGKELTAIEKLFKPFTFEVWIVIGALLITAAVVIVALTMFNPKLYNFVIGRNVRNPMQNIIASVIGISLHNQPKRNFARFLLMVFVLYCLVVRSIYQGGLFKVLKTRSSESEVSTIQEMVDKKFDFYLYESLASRSQSFSFYPLRVIYQSSDMESMLMKTLNPNSKSVVFVYSDTVFYINQRYRNLTLTVCKERFVTGQFVFYFRKNHFVVTEINKKIDMMLTNGMIQHITSKYFIPGFQNDHETGDEKKVLTLGHFKGVFEILFIYYTLALSIFLIEVLTKFKRLTRFRKFMDCIQLKILK